MRVVMLSHHYLPHKGGVEKHIKKITHELGKKGHHVTLVTKREAGLRVKEKVGKINVERISVANIKYLALVFIWVQILTKIKLFIGADIIHIHDVFIWYLPLKFFLPFKKVYVTFHGWQEKYPIPKKEIFMNRVASCFSNGSIAVGEYVKKHFGVKPSFITYGAVNNLGAKNDKKMYDMVFLGRLEKETGFEIFWEFVKNSNIKYLIMGEGSLAFLVQDDPLYLGFVEKPQKYLKSAKAIFCVGYLSILEAMAVKAQVISFSNNPVRQDYLKLTPFSDDIHVVKNVQELKNLKFKKSDLEKNFEYVSSKTWGNMALSYEKLWRV